jgi:hypothetical protein
VIAKAKDPGAVQAMLSGSFFQTELMLNGGAIGTVGLVAGYVIGPFLAGFLLGYLAQSNPRMHLHVFAVVVAFAWMFGVITDSSAQGVGSALLFSSLGVLLLLSGGYWASWRRARVITSSR